MKRLFPPTERKQAYEEGERHRLPRRKERGEQTLPDAIKKKLPFTRWSKATRKEKSKKKKGLPLRVKTQKRKKEKTELRHPITRPEKSRRKEKKTELLRAA